MIWRASSDSFGCTQACWVIFSGTVWKNLLWTASDLRTILTLTATTAPREESFTRAVTLTDSARPARFNQAFSCPRMGLLGPTSSTASVIGVCTVGAGKCFTDYHLWVCSSSCCCYWWSKDEGDKNLRQSTGEENLHTPVLVWSLTLCFRRMQSSLVIYLELS